MTAPHDRPANAGAAREAIAVVAFEAADAHAGHEVQHALGVRRSLEQVQEPVLHADEARRAFDDLRQQLARLQALEQPQGRLVHGGEVQVARRVVGHLAGAVRRLGEVQRPVGVGHEGVLVGGVLRVVRDADAHRHRRPEGLRQPGDGGAHPLADLPCPGIVRLRQQDGELVTAVAVDAILVADRLAHRIRHPVQQGIARGVAMRVVVGLERVEVQHEERERHAAFDELVELALERAVVAEPGQRVVLGLRDHRAVGLGVAQRDRRLRREQLDELELVAREVGFLPAHAAHVERADDLARHEERAHDHRLRLLGRARDVHDPRVQVGVVGQHGLAVADRPAGDAGVERALVAQDQLREPVPGDHGPPHPGGPVHAVDRQRVVGHQRLEGVRDHLEDATRVQGGQQPLVDLQEASLALETVAQLLLLAVDLAERLRVHQCLRGVAGEDLEDPLVILAVLVVARLGQDDDAQDTRLVGHRDEQHGFGPAALPDLATPNVARRIADADRRVVQRHPPREALADPRPQELHRRGPDPHELALERDGLAGLGDVVNAVDPDRVVPDEPVRLGDDRLADALQLLDPVEAR